MRDHRAHGDRGAPQNGISYSMVPLAGTVLVVRVHSCGFRIRCRHSHREVSLMTGRRRFLRSLSTGIAAPLFAPAATVPPMPAHGDPAYWTKIRDQFLLARDKVYFNNGTI